MDDNKTRSLLSHPRQSSNNGGNANPTSSGQSSVFVARVLKKRAELESLTQLRDLSAEMAGQMSMLEEKLATLSGGTEVVATVLGNWSNVMVAINMASMKIPKPKKEDKKDVVPLPQTLVRIPTDHVPAAFLQEQ